MPDFVSEFKELDIFYITYMAVQLFCQFAKYYRKKEPEDIIKETLRLQLQVVLIPLLLL